MKVISIYGPVGSGKSTLLDKLKSSIPNSYIIPEYIDVLDDAENKLKAYLEGSYSAFKFQEFILDYYESISEKLKDSNYDYIFVERTPVEGITFFAKLDLINKRMTNAQYEYLLNRAKSMKFYPDPSTDKFIIIDTDSLSPSQISGLTLGYVQSYRIIKLKASMKTIKERIIKRGRLCELEHYSDDYLQLMIETYDS